MSEEQALSPCPFCGEPVRLRKSAVGDDWIEHEPRKGAPECGMEFSKFNMLGPLVEAWNTRSQRDGDVVERVARAIYEVEPTRDQEVDLDGRPTGPPYIVPWESIVECYAATHEAMTEFARAALSAMGTQRDGWLPIETAPKDGTPILVTNDERGGTWVAQYSERYASGMNRENPWFSLMLNMRWHPNQYASTLPTHWQPLPSPPGTPNQRDELRAENERLKVALENVLAIAEALSGDVPVSRAVWQELRRARQAQKER